LLKDDCLQKIKWIAEQHKKFIHQLTINHSLLTIKNLRILGTILAFEIVSGKDEYLNSISTTITQQAMQMGIYIRPLGNTVYIMPPYCITED
ncbi:aminotransferase class III-fold pyridoxal phosphate-dependent enzyme, partial [Acinetobacter baumannii]